MNFKQALAAREAAREEEEGIQNVNPHRHRDCCPSLPRMMELVQNPTLGTPEEIDHFGSGCRYCELTIQWLNIE